MQQATTVSAVKHILQSLRRTGRPVIFVPTMGNLHAGHMALVERAKSMQGIVVVSLFINPTQFLGREDYKDYPRSLDADLEKLINAQVDVVFSPTVAEIYPAGDVTHTQVIVPDLDGIYCGRFRPGHFTGVATIVTKLFNIIVPNYAVFGIKDYQQLLIIKRVVRDLLFSIKIIAGPTVREKNGLAVSSRNQYLDRAGLRTAPLLYQYLASMAAEIETGRTDFSALEKNVYAQLQDAGFKPDYITVCNAQDLSLPEESTKRLIILAAARLGKARLIDNVPVGDWDYTNMCP